MSNFKRRAASQQANDKASRDAQARLPYLKNLCYRLAIGRNVIDLCTPETSECCNLNAAFGAPGEICLAYEYYASFSIHSGSWHYGIWQRHSNSAANRFTQSLEKLQAFQTLSGDDL